MTFWFKYTVAIVVILFVVQSCVCTEISHPNITGNATCDDVMEFFADGVRYIHDNDNNYYAPSPINIPGSTQLIAIKCRNYGYWNGVSVVLSNGIKTDTSWKCSDDEEDGWNNVTFDDTAWRNAKLLPFWILTTADLYGTGAIYCRKSINSTISDLQITGRAYCYDEMEFYADGVQYKHDNDDKWSGASPVNISSSTKLIAIRCINTGGWRGLNVGLSNGVRTDTTWKCSDEEEYGWNTVGFNDSVWSNAKLLRDINADRISTTDNANQFGTIYCRKSLFLEPSSPTKKVVELSTATTKLVEPSSTTTTASTTVSEPFSPTTTATTTVAEPFSPTTTATTTVPEPFSATTTALSFDHRYASYSKSNIVVNTCDPSRFLESIYTSRKMDCARACTEDADCKRYLYCSSNSSCNLYQDGRDCVMSVDTTGCSCYTQNIRCEDSNCTCPLGKYGQGCHDIISDCTEGSQKGLRSTNNVLTTIKPLAFPDSVEVLCTFDDGGWTGILGRNKDCLHENFNRTLEEYEEGFGNVASNKWLGLKHVLYLLDNPNSTYSLRVVLVKPDASTCVSQYTNFVIANKSTSYTLYIGGYTGVGTSCGDSLTGTINLNNNPFSTYDVDYTGTFECANRFGGGWWYGSHADCTSSLLTGSMDSSSAENFWKESLPDSELNKIYLQLQRN